jgi:hypothetical protein
VWLAAEAASGEAEFPAQFIAVLAAAIRQLHAFEVVPDPSIGVEVGGVAGQLDELEAGGRAGGEEILDGLGTVDGRAVPDHEQPAPHLPQELAEEGDDRRPPDRLISDVGKGRPA